MIKYSDLVNYIKENHINWNEDLFEVLKGFFRDYYTPKNPSTSFSQHIQQELLFSEEFKEPENGEYTIQDTLNLFNL